MQKHSSWGAKKGVVVSLIKPQVLSETTSSPIKSLKMTKRTWFDENVENLLKMDDNYHENNVILDSFEKKQEKRSDKAVYNKSQILRIYMDTFYKTH